jgi:glycerophosphoryl diester phosphodiesterase
LKFDFGAKHDKRFHGLKIPTFEEILQKFAGRVIMNIHVKIWDHEYEDNKLDEIVALLRKYDCEKHMYFMTISDRMIRMVHERYPGLKCCVGWDRNKDPMSMVNRAIALGAYKVQLYKPYFNQETVDKAHAHGILCNVFWSDDCEEAINYRQMGIDTILTNDYLTIKNCLEQHN